MLLYFHTVYKDKRKFSNNVPHFCKNFFLWKSLEREQTWQRKNESGSLLSTLFEVPPGSERAKATETLDYALVVKTLQCRRLVRERKLAL